MTNKNILNKYLIWFNIIENLNTTAYVKFFATKKFGKNLHGRNGRDEQEKELILN